MNGIPEDVMQAARTVADHLYASGSSSYAFAANIVGRAILAERERCAKVAQCDCCDVCGESPGYPKCANEIADEIRRGN